MRPDGTRVKGLSAVVQALPYVMPKRYDAQNMTTETAERTSSASTSGRSAGRAGPSPT